MVELCQLKRKRKVLGVTMKGEVRNTEVNGMTSLGDACACAKMLKWRWEDM
jgi:hypothetical protein